MITAQDIKKILGKIPKGNTLTVEEIQNRIENNFPLTASDFAPYTTTRPTSYPRWHHSVQSVLAEYKKSQKVVHDPETNSYTF